MHLLSSYIISLSEISDFIQFGSKISSCLDKRSEFPQLSVQQMVLVGKPRVCNYGSMECRLQPPQLNTVPNILQSSKGYDRACAYFHTEILLLTFLLTHRSPIYVFCCIE